MNQDQRDHIQAVTSGFDFRKVHVDTEYATDPHYTAVVHTNGAVHDALVRLQQAYREFDNSLQCVDPDLLHVTLGTAKILEGHEKLTSVVKGYIARRPTVKSAGLVATDARGALGVAFWSDDNIFLNFRQELAQAYNREFQPDLRMTAGWATLARFTQAPPRELIDYIQDNVFMELGEMVFDNATIYEPIRRDLKESRVVLTINS